MSSSFSQVKRLRFTFALNGATFNDQGDNVLQVTDLRAIVNVRSAGAFAWTAARIQIFGMLQSDMNKLTQLSWDPRGLLRNNLLIEADGGDGWQNVFVGNMISAGPDYSGAPDAALIAECSSVYYDQLNPTIPSSYPVPTSVATIVSNLAAAMSKAFENNGVDVQITAPYLPGTYADQLKTICEQANIQLYDENNIIAIAPAGQPRDVPIVLLTPDTGLVGYPTIDNIRIYFSCLYNPAIRFGGRVELADSAVPAANGVWWVSSIDHMLESERPGGAWFSTLTCSKSGEALPYG